MIPVFRVISRGNHIKSSHLDVKCIEEYHLKALINNLYKVNNLNPSILAS